MPTPSSMAQLMIFLFNDNFSGTPLASGTILPGFVHLGDKGSVNISSFVTPLKNALTWHKRIYDSEHEKFRERVE